jgi:hypothetical protein
MRTPEDPYPDVLQQVMVARIAGDQRAAQVLIDAITFVPGERRSERWPARSVIAAVYAEDHYQCRYCGERVILTPIMRLLARLYPEQFPYNPNWRADSTHPAFVSRSATLDHVVPIADGGDPLAPSKPGDGVLGMQPAQGRPATGGDRLVPRRAGRPDVAGPHGTLLPAVGSRRSARPGRGRTVVAAGDPQVRDPRSW